MYNITPKEVYDFLINNEKILDIYSKIECREAAGGGWAFHNFVHVMNVSSLAEKILTDLNFDSDMIYKCKIACLLHDVGALEKKDGHAFRSYQYSLNLFRDNNWIFPDMDIVLDAIREHSDGFFSDSILTLSIILADKLDVKRSRISPLGMEVVGNRQYSHIDDIDINICDGVLSINFITDGNIDIDEVNNYYFTLKIFKAIDAFSKKVGLSYIVLLDGNEWVLDCFDNSKLL